MTRKESVIYATDRIANALQALCRVNYDNERQASSNMAIATQALQQAANALNQQGPST